MAAIVFAMAFAAPAKADICSDLRAQLASAKQASGSTAKYNRYADAARRQANEIRKAQQAQRASNCFLNPSAQCQSLNRTIQQMKANLNTLERTRDRAAPRRNPGRIRAIETRLRANGCERPLNVVRVAPDRARSSNGKRVIVREGVDRLREQNALGTLRNTIIVPEIASTFRTMCVRTCDGYYFPISFATGPEFFERDQEACRAMCPAAETRLYFHRVPDEESEAMVSLEGEAYTALPTAFLYRQRNQSKSDPSCTCGTPTTLANMSPDEVGPEAADTSVPLPGRKPDSLSDPESRMNAETGLTKEAVRELTGGVSQGDVRASTSNRQVRVVGPQFLPDPGEAIDLRSPDRKTDQ
jgi:hypothetical protein